MSRRNTTEIKAPELDLVVERIWRVTCQKQTSSRDNENDTDMVLVVEDATRPVMAKVMESSQKKWIAPTW